MKNLLMGTIFKYSWEEVEPFFRSFEFCKTTDTHIVAIVSQMSKRSIRHLNRHGIETVEFDMNNAQGKWVTEYRWYLYKQYLEQSKTQYDKIFLSDIRDVIFQKDIFETSYDDPEWILFAQETEKLGYEESNATWFEKRFGKDELSAFSEKPIICAGTTLGTYNAIKLLIDKMIDTMDDPKYYFSRNCDQANMMYVIYKGMLGNTAIYTSTNKTGPILTLYTEKNPKYDNNYVYNHHGDIAAVVHQYDPKQPILDIVLRKYSTASNLVHWMLHHHFRSFWRKQ